MYCTVADLKTYLGITSDSDDRFLMACIERATAIIDMNVGFPFEAVATTRSYDSEANTDGYTLLFDTWCCEIQQVTNGDGTIVAETDYVKLPSNAKRWYGIRIKSSTGLYWTYEDDPEEALAVQGCWAWSETAPADIAQAAVRLSGWIYRQKDTNADVDRPLLTGDGNVLLPNTLPTDILNVLAVYKPVIF